IFFFFQAEDGIRDLYVTGVQTCALPIFLITGGASGDEDSATFEIHKIPFMSVVRGNAFSFWRTDLSARHESCFLDLVRSYGMMRSEERRVGKECRSRWWT